MPRFEFHLVDKNSHGGLPLWLRGSSRSHSLGVWEHGNHCLVPEIQNWFPYAGNKGRNHFDYLLGTGSRYWFP